MQSLGWDLLSRGLTTDPRDHRRLPGRGLRRACRGPSSTSTRWRCCSSCASWAPRRSPRPATDGGAGPGRRTASSSAAPSTRSSASSATSSRSTSSSRSRSAPAPTTRSPRSATTPAGQDQLLRWMRARGHRPARSSPTRTSSRAPGRPRVQRRQGPGLRRHRTTCSRSSSARPQAPDKGRAFFLEFAAKQLVVVARPRLPRASTSRGTGTRRRSAASWRWPTPTPADDWRSLVKDVAWGLPGAFQPVRGGRRRAVDRTSSTGHTRASLTPAARQRARRRRRPVLQGQPAAPRARVRARHRPASRPGPRIYGEGRARPPRASRSTCSSRRPRCRCSTAATAATARCPTSRTCAPSPTARRTSATARAAAPTTGMCEVPGHTCVWADAYQRLKPYGEERSMLDRAPVVQDNALRRTSAWANTFLGPRPLRAAAPAADAQPATAADRAVAPPHRRERTPVVKPDRTGTAVPRRRREHPRHPRPQADRQARRRARRTGPSGIAFEAADGQPPGPARSTRPRRGARLRRRARSSTSPARSAGASRAASRRRTAAAYIQTLAARQERTGADWLDLNADEMLRLGCRARPRRWRGS